MYYDANGKLVDGPGGPQPPKPAYAQGVSGNTRDGSIKTYYNPQAGKVQNDSAWGGYSGYMYQTPDGRWVSDQSKSGRAEDVARYQGMGAAAAQRQAYQLDWTQADQDRAMAQQARGYQGDAADIYRRTAMGEDTRAQALGRTMLEQSRQQQLGAAVSTGGDSLSRAGALHTAQNNQGAFTLQGNQLLAAQKADAEAKAREGWFNEMTAQRQGDQTGQGLADQQSQLQMQSELGQRGLNQDQQLWGEGMAYDTNAQSQKGALESMGVDTTRMNTGLQSDARDFGRNSRYVAAGVSAIGAGFGSDERLKRNVRGLAYACSRRG